MKHGQVSIFILLGILFLFFLGFFVFYAQSPQRESMEKIEEISIAPLQVYIEQCLEDVGKNGITFISLQGGYYNTPAPAYSFGLYTLPYYYNDNKSTVPSVETIESELEDYVNKKLSFCTQNFTSFREQGYTITAGDLETTTIIQEDIIQFTTAYPVTATLGESTKSYTSFSTEIPSELFLAHTIAEQIIAAHNGDAKIPLSKITTIAETYRIFLNLGNFNDTVLYILNIPTENIDKPFIYQFAVHYDWGDPLE